MNTAICLTVLLVCMQSASSINADKSVLPHIALRSQGSYTPRRIVGHANHLHTHQALYCYGSVATAVEFRRSFDSDALRSCLFGNDLQECNHIRISGSRVTQRKERDWLADYFYLPPDFSSTIRCDPVINSIIIDPTLYVGLDQWLSGLYVNLSFPIAHSTWDLQYTEQVTTPGTLGHDIGYFNSDADGIARDQLLHSFSEFARGDSFIPAANQAIIGFQGLNKARINGDKNIKTRVADLRATLGWHFINTRDTHVGFQIQGALATGNKPTGNFLFEALVGNEHHAELGIGIDGKHTVWYSADEEQQITCVGSWTIAHLFSSTLERTFDLRNKPLSRYMLAQKMVTPAVDLRAGTSPAPYQFARMFAPVANITTMSVDVTIPYQTELTLMLHYMRTHWTFDVGYNFWARACERFRPLVNKALVTQENWALKGDAYVFGFTQGTNSPVALSATERLATIHSGTNFTNMTSLSDARKNLGIDSPKLAFNGSGTILNTTINGADQILSSSDPYILSLNDIAFTGQRAHSNSIFAHISYAWDQRSYGWEPFIGVGGSVEFAGTHTQENCHTNRSVSNCDDTCVTCGIHQWGIWLKGGVTFD